jgi:MoaA/NifB/PqqE/SkfB family radical SAM enzyme
MMIRLNPKRVALSGGEPLLVRGWSEAARRLRDAGVYVTLYTSGWTLDEALAEEFVHSVSDACVSIDGATEATHDRLRRRAGSYRKARAALELLARFKRERKARGETCYTLGTDFTVVRSNSGELEQFVTDVTASYPGLDYVRFGMAVPEGPAADEDFAAQELLTTEEMLALNEAEGQLKALAHNGVRVSVTDMRYYIPYSPYGGAGATIAHIEPDGQLRAFGVYEAKVGNVLHEPFEVLWSRALAWRNEPFVAEQIKSIHTNHDWARVARVLDRRYGSEDDKARIALRTAGRGRSI